MANWVAILRLAYFLALWGGDSRVAGGTAPLAFRGVVVYGRVHSKDVLNILAVTAGGTHPHLRGRMSHGVYLFWETIMATQEPRNLC